MANEPEQLAVGIDTATRITGAGRTTIFEAVKRGELRSIKLGKRRLFMVDDLRDWLEHHEDRSAA